MGRKYLKNDLSWCPGCRPQRVDHGDGPGQRQRAAALLRRGQLRAGVAAEWAGPAGGALVLRPRHGLPDGRRQVPGPQGILLLRVGLRLLGGAGEELGARPILAQ